jgi:hypothetical protein
MLDLQIQKQGNKISHQIMEFSILQKIRIKEHELVILQHQQELFSVQSQLA